MERKDLDKLSRAELVAKAEELGVVRPRTLTMAELVDEILLANERSTGQRKPRGWFGRARDLLTSVIDRGVSADPLRKASSRTTAAAPPPLPTVTLAEIYAAQGHFERAITTLDEVIAADPAHAEAQKLRDRFAEQLKKTRPASSPPPASASVAAEPKNEASSTESAAAAEPATPIDADVTEATAIAERYDVDEVVAVAVDPHTLYVYWEVRASTLAPLRAEAPDGALTLRVLVVGGQGKPAGEARDIRVDAVDGDLFVRDVVASAEIRVAIGWLAGATFSPIAVGLDLTTPREAKADEVAVQFGRMSAGGISDGYDPLRRGGLVGDRPAAPTFSRATPEEISLGHAAETHEGSADFPSYDGAIEITRTARASTILERETRRIGASELLVTERTFRGASDRLAGGVSSYGARGFAPPTHTESVSFVVPAHARR